MIQLLVTDLQVKHKRLVGRTGSEPTRLRTEKGLTLSASGRCKIPVIEER